LKHTRKHKKGREESNQEAKHSASGGPSGQAGRTVRDGPRGPFGRVPRTVRTTADGPHPSRGLSGLSRGPSVKANRSPSSEPRKTDRPRGARGLSIRHLRAVRPLMRTVRNNFQPKLKTKTDRKRSRARTRRTRKEHGSRGPSARPSRTVRQARTELKTARPRKSTPPNHHRISQTVEAVETRVWGLEKRHTRML
jgi:hypothetical protein